MFRFLARFIGVWLVAASLVVAVVDGAKSIAASSLVLTPLAETWATISEAASSNSEAGGPAELPWPLDIAIAWLLAAPTAAVLFVIGFLLLIAGRKRRERDAFGREYPA